MPATPPAPRSIRSLPSWLLGRAAARGRGLVAEVLAREGLTMWQHVVLAAAADLGPVAQAELGRSISLDPKDMVAVLNALQDAGLIERTPHPADRRKNAVTVTEEGRRVAERCAVAARGANEALLAALTPEERKRFTDMLYRVSGVRE